MIREFLLPSLQPASARYLLAVIFVVFSLRIPNSPPRQQVVSDMPAHAGGVSDGAEAP
jgi:hypothetical protein